MKPRQPGQFLKSLRRQSTGFHLHIVVLNKSKSQMYLKSFGRLFHITDSKYLIELAPKNCVYTRNSDIRLRTKIIVTIYNTKKEKLISTRAKLSSCLEINTLCFGNVDHYIINTIIDGCKLLKIFQRVLMFNSKETIKVAQKKKKRHMGDR